MIQRNQYLKCNEKLIVTFQGAILLNTNEPNLISLQALEAKVRFSCKLTKDCKELIRMLLVTDPTKRIGNLRKGVREIAEHNFFK